MSLSNSDFPKSIRAALVKRGDSLNAWAKRHRYKPATVYAAVHGHRTGKVSVLIRGKLNREILAAA